MVVAYIGLGSNLDEPRNQVNRALAELDSLPRTRLLSRSSLYRSVPLGPQDQPDYINAVAAVETELAAAELLAELQRLENGHGRQRGAQRWGPRTLDLDLLLYGQERIDTPGLSVPHPGLSVRNFVLYPLREIAPDLAVPGMGSVAGLAEACGGEGLEKIEEGRPHPVDDNGLS